MTERIDSEEVNDWTATEGNSEFAVTAYLSSFRVRKGAGCPIAKVKVAHIRPKDGASLALSDGAAVRIVRVLTGRERSTVPTADGCIELKDGQGCLLFAYLTGTVSRDEISRTVVDHLLRYMAHREGRTK